ncbi:hypothetical protein ESO86_04715 [Agromyces binzhouensis]|uniref:Uncharacterized protein n=1 Tax=Agromyces binzhouensis TaxID=1817495 RepID=A0A4Q2JPI5_9MICO|nr:hypothetical protein ESO86_04715 [Agromyces binzhouensis]
MLISAPVVRPEFARMVVEAAYGAGAISADVLWFDDAVDRSRFTHGSADAAGALPGSALFRLADFEAGASFLRIHAADPAKFAGVDQALVQQQNPPRDGVHPAPDGGDGHRARALDGRRGADPRVGVERVPRR